MRRSLVALAIAALAIAAPSALVPDAVAAATFGRPAAHATFGEEIVFDQPVRFDGAVDGVEILVESQGTLGSFVASVDADRSTTTLTYRWDTAADHVLPNTTLTARWRVIEDDGTVEVGPPVSIRYEDTRFAWRTAEGEHARLHWHAGSDAFGQSMLDLAETSIAETTDLLGVESFAPVDFFVYADEEAFRAAVGPNVPETAGGVAFAHIRTMFGRVGAAQVDDPWVNILIPHELVHLVFDAAVDNPYNYPPHWLNEGLAVYLTQGYGVDDRAAIEGAVRKRSVMPLTALDLTFPAPAEKFSLGYSEGVSAVDHLIRVHGPDALVDLIRSYRSGVGDDDAFRASLGIDVAGFEDEWLADLGAEQPVAYGPQAAPPGPLPAGWIGAPDGSPAPTPAGAVPGGAPPADGSSSAPLALAIAALLLGIAGVALIVRGRRARREPTR